MHSAVSDSFVDMVLGVSRQPMFVLIFCCCLTCASKETFNCGGSGTVVQYSLIPLWLFDQTYFSLMDDYMFLMHYAIDYVILLL